jgi:hypothetical protein
MQSASNVIPFPAPKQQDPADNLLVSQRELEHILELQAIERRVRVQLASGAEVEAGRYRASVEFTEDSAMTRPVLVIR